MDYVGIGPLFFYVHDEAKLITRNTVKAYFDYVYKREGGTCKLVELHSQKDQFNINLWIVIVRYGYFCLIAHVIKKKLVSLEKGSKFLLHAPRFLGIASCEKSEYSYNGTLKKIVFRDIRQYLNK